jgi:3-methyl-2-oxobutanoate hydroxymethyltransferase
VAGGYGSAGRTAEAARRIVEDAVALEQAGAVLLLIEAVPDAVTERVLDKTSVPVIGIGAGTTCHGQVLVLHDLIGLTDHPPRFAGRSAEVGTQIEASGRDWVDRVARREIGGRRYTMPEEEHARFEAFYS